MACKKILFLIPAGFWLAAALGAGDFNALYRGGLRKISAGDYKGALTEFKAAYKAAELSSEEVKILFAVADTYYRLKEYKEAHKWAARILDIPDLKHGARMDAYRRLISYSKQLKRYDDAKDEISLALRDAADDKEKIIFLNENARLMETQKDYSGAAGAWLECVAGCREFSPEWEAAQKEYIAVLFKLKDYLKILKHIDALKADSWKSSAQQFIFYYAGLCACKLGNYKLAVKWLEKMSSREPAWLVYSKNNQLGDTWKKLHEYEKAYKCYEVIYKNTDLHNYYRANSLLLMAELRYTQKKYPEAASLCEELKKFPKASASQIKRADRLLVLIKKAKP
ncbi:MAG: tetratricopeptide repeat protein [Victivallaceae bacterium]|nr:tetratricopeptide repeat protein [Victivallaceae bacterium]